jgi:tetratricopeptide (TPR) repeat protein
VYSLGLVLYELVTGERPYDLSDTTIYEALRIIREEPPRPPSRFEPACRGDLETVLLHALEKDADHRYAAVSELAQDLRRWIAREPIAARPPSTAHRLRLFASRNPLAASALVAAVLALVAGAGVATAFGLREARAHAESDRQARIAVEVNDFLNEDVLGAVDPYQSANPDLRVREALDRAADKIGGRTFSEPLVEAGIRASIGRGYLSLGLPTPALAHLDPAGTIIRRERGDDHLESLHARQNVARARLLAGDVGAADEEAQALRADYERLGEAVAGNGTDLARLLGLQAEIARRRGDARSALGLYEAAHLRHVAALGVDHILSIAFECSLAECLREIGRLEDSESMQRDALERSRRTLGDDHPRTVVSLANLALVRQDRGALEEARTLLEEAVSTGVRVQGARHEATLTDRRNLALVLKQLGRNDEAAREIELAIDGFRESLGERHALTLGALLVHGQVAMQTGRFEAAEQTLLEVTEIGREVLGNGHPLVLEAALNLARLLAHTDRRGNAIDLLREELDAADDPAADAPPGERVLALRNEYGKLLLDAGRPEEAEPILARVVRDLRATLGTHMGTAVSLRMHAKSLEALKRTEEARRSYEGSRAILVELLGADHTFVRRIDQDLSVLGKSKDAGTGR